MKCRHETHLSTCKNREIKKHDLQVSFLVEYISCHKFANHDADHVNGVVINNNGRNEF